MANGNLGGLYMSLDIQSKIDKKLKNYQASLKSFEDGIKTVQKAINTLSAEMDKVEKGSDVWNKQRESMAAYMRLVDDLFGKIKKCEEGIKRYERIDSRIKGGGLLIPSRSFTSLQDTKPIEAQITKYERILQLLKEIPDYEQRIAAVRKRTVGRIGGFGVENYTETTSRLRAGLASMREELSRLGGEGMSVERIKSQLDSLYFVLGQYDKANRQAKESVHAQRDSEQRRIKALNDARIAFEPLIAQMAREEAQERANRANIEATNRARQKGVQSLRTQSEALMRNKEAALASQKASLGRLYLQGQAAGLDPSQLETIRNRYREISSELLNLRSMMQNPKDLSYREMFEMGRFTGSGSNFIREAGRQVADLRQKTTETAQAARDAASAFSRMYGAAERTSSALSDMKNLLLQGGIVYGAQRFANSIIKTGGDIVQQHIALRSILGDIQQADTLFSQAQQLALQSPFTFQELNRDVKQLAAFGVDTDKLYDTTKRLADVASGLGVSFERLGLAYGQVKARSWLDGKELRQFAYAGLPLLQKITDLYNETGRGGRSNYTESEVKTMISKRLVSFEDVDEVIRRLTDEGGQFYNMQFVLSETLLGRWNKLIDAWDIMLGKFADGDNILGKTFMNAINAATEFVLALDRIAPALLGAGAVFSGKAILGGLMAKGGVGISRIQTIMSAVTKEQLRQYGMSQMQQTAEGKITAEKARQLVMDRQKILSSAEFRNLTYAQLFSEGKISSLQLAQLLRRKQISAEMVSQLRLMGLLTARQEQLILRAQRERSVRSQTTSMLSLGAGSATNAFTGFFSTGNIVMAAGAVAAAIGLAYKQWSDNINSMADNARTALKQRAEQTANALKQVKETGATRESVRQMQDLVEQSGYYTTTIKEQIDSATTLTEQYDTLYGILEKIRQMEEEGSRHNYSDVIKASAGKDLGGMFNPFSSEFYHPLNILGRMVPWANLLPTTHSGLSDFLYNDDITKNLGQFTEAQSQLDFVSGNVQAYSGDIRKAIENVKGSYGDLYNSVKNKPIEEQLKILSQSDAWDEIVDRVSSSNREFEGIADKFKDNSEDVADKWNEIVSDDIPRMALRLAKDNGMTLNEFKAFCRNYQGAADAMLQNIVNSMNNVSEETRNKLLNVFRDFLGIEGENITPKKKERTAEEKQTTVGRTIMRNLRSHGNDGTVTAEEMNEWASTENFADAAKAIKSAYDARKAEYEAAEKANAETAELSKKKADLDQITKVAEAAGVDLTDKKEAASKRKEESAARKTDQATLKALQARLDLIKDAYNMYQKYYRVLHSEESAAKEVSDRFSGQGLSSDDVSKIKSSTGYKGLVEDYLNRVRKAVFLMPQEMQDRRDSLISSGVKELNDIDYNNLTDDIKKSADQTERALKRMSRAWNTFSSVYSATGNANLAGGIAGLTGTTGESWYSDLIKEYIQKNFPSDSIPSNLEEMGDKDIAVFAGSVQGLDRQKIDALIATLKSLRDAIDKENNDTVSQMSAILQGDVREKTRTDRINKSSEERNKVIATLDEGEYKTLMQSLSDTDKKVELVKATDNYAAFMENAVSITSDTADEIVGGLVTNLKEKLNAGGITQEEYLKEVEELLIKRVEVKTRLSDIQTFMSSGLDSMYRKMIKDGLRTDNDTLVKRGQSGLVNMQKVKVLNDTINKIVESFNALESVLQPLVDVASALGNTGIQKGVSIASSAVGAANSAMGGMGTLSEMAHGLGMSGIGNALSSAAPYGAAAGMALSVASSLLGGKSSSMKAWEKANKHLENLESVTKEINQNLESDITSSSGSGSISAARSLYQNNQDLLESNRSTYLKWTNAKTHKGGHRNRMKTGLDYDELNAWLEEIGWDPLSYNGDIGDISQISGKTNSDGRFLWYVRYYIGSQEIQNLDPDILKEFRDTHASAWADMNEQAKEYLDRIIEIGAAEGELDQVSEKLIKALAGWDTDTLSSDYANLLDDLSSQTDDFSDNLEKKMRSAILSSMLTNLYADRIEDLKDLTNNLGSNDTYLDKNGNVRKHVNRDANGNLTYDEDDIASEYTADEYKIIEDSNKELSDAITGTRDMLEDKFGWDDSSSASMSNSVNGITEQTADIGVSYLNAIRADGSVRRQLQGLYLPKLDITATAQLQQLGMITENTRRNAESAERMERTLSDIGTIFDRVCNDRSTLSVKIK